MKVVRGGPAPLTLVSLGRWAGIAGAAGNLPAAALCFMLLGRPTGLRADPAPLTLVSLGRWASIAAAAGDASRGSRA
jgi:hypothetical protein